MKTKMNESARLHIEDEGSRLADGEQSKVDVCPFCDGGTTGADKSFSVRRRGSSLLFICYRDSCQSKGVLRSTGVLSSRKALNVKSSNDTSRYTERTEELPPWTYPTLMIRWCLSSEEIARAGMRYQRAGDRVIIPVNDVFKRNIGVVSRALYSDDKVKSLNYIHDGDNLAWFTTGRTRTPDLVIVEDPLSAIRVSTYCDSAALLGTHLSLDKLKQLATYKYERIWVALDADALSTAVKIIKDNALFLSSVNLLSIPKDFKNMSRTELHDFLVEKKVVLE